uniref:Uncharacterized protein MANES_18G010900 n=1 Tax=Rhizophora mucronata TaxID=61149 RepID=A0A2P2IWG5_RHIMU
MRTKTRCPRARPSKSPQKPSHTTSARPIPPINPDGCDAEAEASVDEIMREKSRKGDGCKKKHKVSNETDVFEGKESGLDRKKVDWLRNDACLRCNRDGKLIFCSEQGCPLAFHRECMEFEPKFDEKGMFYCPYCWFKLQVSRTLFLREKAMLAKKALLDFMNSKTSSENEEKQDVRRAEGKSSTEVPWVGGRSEGEILGEMKDHQNEKGFKKLDEYDPFGGVVEIDCHKNMNEHCGQKEKIQGVEPLNNYVHEKKKNDKKILHPYNFRVLDDEGMKEQDDDYVGDGMDDEIVEESPNTYCVEEESILNDTPNGSKESLHQDALETLRGEEVAQKVPKTSDINSETIVVHRKRFKHIVKKKVTQPHIARSSKKVSFQTHNNLEANTSNQYKKTSSFENSRRPQESTSTFSNLHFAQDKRKRLYWTPEEEDMLKEGVQKFSIEVNKNIPWRKILESGRHIFHATRTPNDLRDKWRKIVVKEF